MKDERKEKLYIKGEEGILLGYSIRRKAYKCLNINSTKFLESINVKVNEFMRKTKKGRKRNLKIIKPSCIIMKVCLLKKL